MATDDDDDDDDDVEDVKGGRAEGGMRRGVGIDGKGWRCGGRGKCSHNNDVVLFSHSHTLSLCIITALPVHNSASPRNCTIESVPPSLNNFELFSQSTQQQLRAASTTNYVGPTATAVGWPLYADVQSIIIK